MDKTTAAAESLLPTDPFDRALENLIGLPNGAHTAPTTTQARDFYGNTTTFVVQTVKTDEGHTIFLTQVNAAGSARYVLAPNVLRVIDRQRESTIAQVRRRHGRRLAADRPAPVFTPEMRAKGIETRKANAAKRRRRRAKKKATR